MDLQSNKIVTIYLISLIGIHLHMWYRMLVRLLPNPWKARFVGAKSVTDRYLRVASAALSATNIE